MQEISIAFAGMGSIGRRHFFDVQAYFARRGQPCRIDVYRSGKGAPLDAEIAQQVRKTFLLSEIQTISEQYDVVFINNPTALHYDTIRRFALAARAMFIEKPVFDRTDADVSALELPEETICYVACPLRYHPVIEYARAHIPCEQAYAVRAICSSYLPDWRPNTDYRACYSAHRDMGGGVGIDLVHEWDYLSFLFGRVESGYSIMDRVSALEIDSDDIAVYIARTRHTVIELHLDYFGRPGMREMQIFLPNETVVCDILNGSVRYPATGRTHTFDCSRDAYQMREIEHFFAILDGACANDSDIAGALRVLRHAKGEF